jgi:hypothetical protein
MTREEILELLTSKKFIDFANGIEKIETYFKESGFDDRVFEHALSVFTYHLDHKHEEIAAAYESIGKNFSLFFSVIKADEKASSDWFTRGQIEGLSTFLSNFKEGKLDLSNYFLASGFTYQIVAQSCKNILEITDRNEYAEECNGLEMFYSVFDELWKIQMTVQGIISDTTNWDDYIVVYLFNSTLYKADLESQSRMMAGLSAHENNSSIQRDIVEKYIESLEKQVKKLESQKTQISEFKDQVIKWFPN